MKIEVLHLKIEGKDHFQAYVLNLNANHIEHRKCRWHEINDRLRRQLYLHPQGHKHN